ncbi:TetR/AcrR family transcriptional regulator [Streptomyces montanisoli]|uniref:TetR/AcrR family transcriptional regulator n=1 Tax=Streptomyces montanisoli TaxID=2798581 RepID=A0A940MAE1_9ACTN|nr:TetR/AcrR family transcriptional regulator [Streptomyces montanisoli]MBP0456425.1 TetR/AcrR family transcriptional regulator [Streptomyces montanisoli]
MPRLSDETRARRRHHVLTSAWRCFSENGFHATSMDEVIAATGMSSSAVYRYFRSKEELIDATAEEGITRVRDIFVRLLTCTPTPTPGQTLETIVGELRSRTSNPEYDLSKLAVQTWAEALRNPALRDHTRDLYAETSACITELAERWRAEGHLPPDSDPAATAATVFTLMHGLIVCHHLAPDVLVDQLGPGLTALGSALVPLQRHTP